MYAHHIEIAGRFDRIIVGFLDPQTMVQLTGEDTLRRVADDAGARLQRVREALQGAA